MKNPNAIINLGRDKIHQLQRPKTLNGTVVSKVGIYWTIRTDGPSHLRTLDLVQSQMKGADVGDRVTLVYFSTARYGMWTVDTVLPKEAACLTT